MSYFVHPSAIVDEGAQLGDGTRVWHFVHVSGGARIGRGCSLGQGVYVGNDVRIGDNVIRTLRGEAHAEVDGYEGLRSLEVVIAAYRSARDGVRVGLPLVF